MKRLFLFVMLAVLATSLTAQRPGANRPDRDLQGMGAKLNFNLAERMAAKSDILYRMTSYRTDDNYEFVRFYYSPDNRLVATYDEIPGSYKLYDSVKYDAQGNIVRIDGWQWLNNAWTNVYYVEYGYNEQGLLSSRTNYNYFSGNWELGGVYEYTYNDAGQILRSELTMGGSLFQTIDYAYQDGMLLTELWSDLGFGSQQLEPTELLHYYYSDNSYGQAGRLVTKVVDTIFENGFSFYNGKEEYTYDGVGNCTVFARYDDYGLVVERSEYDFESRLVENTVIPVTPEPARPYVYNNYNTYTVEHWYGLDVNHVLQHVCDYLYTYSTLDGVGIESAAATGLQVYPNPAADMVSVKGAEQLDGAVLTDLAGRTVLRVSAPTFSVANLPQGTYILRLADGESCPIVVVR